jgi:hypothetical protein
MAFIILLNADFRQKSIRQRETRPCPSVPFRFGDRAYPPPSIQRFLLAATLAERAMFLSMKTRARLSIAATPRRNRRGHGAVMPSRCRRQGHRGCESERTTPRMI